MDLQKISIENFKCFGEAIEIELGKLTLLTGANSSGKSSIIYAVLGAIQSGEFPFQFSTNGKYVNMGDFKEIVYNHNKKAEIKLGFTFKNGSVHQIDTVWKEDPSNNLPILSKLHAQSDYFELTAQRKKDKFHIDFSYDSKKDKNNHDRIISEELTDLYIESRFGIGKRKHTITNLEQELYFSQRENNIIVDDLSTYIGSFEEKGTIRLNKLLSVVSNAFNSYDDQINFISSFRLHPERTYLEQTKSKLKVGNYGDGYLDQIISWETKNKAKFKELIAIAKDLNLLDSIKSKRLDGGRYEIAVQIKKDGIDSSLSDVGFGISQFLPIVVADLQLPKSSTLFVAQPEIHLHPSVQSSFGDYLIKQIRAQDKNYVIETHSEYLLNKIRLGIVKGEIKSEDVKVIFVDNESHKNKIHKITFTETGQIVNAPANFFKTYMMDVMEIAINAAQ